MKTTSGSGRSWGCWALDLALSAHLQPWLNPIEMLWRHFRREVTHCELFASMAALLQATADFFVRYNATPDRILSIIGAHPK